ncbi:MAG TPA: MopE-related protein [Polyangiales bacterium]|nr:MopE-related protein [Polyangiales bacterium]
MNSTGDAEFALMQFRHPCRYGGTAATQCDSRSGGDMASTCDADMLVGVSASNYSGLEWVDGACSNDCGSGGFGKEIYAYGYTPIGQSLVRAKQYFTNTLTNWTSPIVADAYSGCRPVAVIMLTDGQENCGGNGVTAATALRTSVVTTSSGNKTIDIKTYAVGFGLNPGDTNIENLANAGGTDAPGPHKGFYAQDEEALSAALNLIITNSQLSERCDGRDNDCDGRIDEDNAKYCDKNGIRTSNPQVLNASNVLVDQSTVDSRVPACSGGTCPAVDGTQGDAKCAAPEWTTSQMCAKKNILCTSPGERCNSQDDDCDGKVDEGAPAIASSNEVCGDGIDNDCDSNIDENCNGCIAQPEICNNANDDCDANIDENLSRSCGSNVGRCTTGTQTCSAGNWSTCSGINPTTETCNNIDDDCDGVVDGMTQQCGTSNVGLCRYGVRTCTAGSYGSCVGNVEPATEVCDNQDNDCNPSTADGSADSRVGKTCGNNRGVCTPGTTICDAGEIKCQGGTSGSAELCNGLDDDCDGNIDEGVAATDSSVNKPCIAPGGVVMYGPVAVQGECRTGTTVCSNGQLACPGYVGPQPELCDSLDQDCDGNNANGVAMTDPRVGQSCGTSLGECDPGQLICSNGSLVCNALPPGTETCNSKDDDCDGLVDENLPASPTSCGNAAQGLCKPGLEACIGGQIVCAGEVKPSPEICDGLDNNCDGNVDEGNPGGGKVCGTNTGECDAGTTICSNGVLSCMGETAAGTESCNGKDDDCDGLTDENNPGGGGRCDKDSNGDPVVGSCRTRLDPENASQPLSEACGECRFGTEVCQAGAIVCVGAVGPKPEKCDGLDNDCDSPCVVDNSDPQNPQLKCPDDPCKLPENDPNYLDCDGKIDEGVAQTDPNVGVICSGGSGECKQGTSQCVGGAVMCIGGQIPVDELCNDKDDDCDTVIDEGFMVGTQCGSNVGECRQGRMECDPNGMSVCVGEKKPSAEVCDGLDNDCDGVVDNGNPGGGMQCGSSEGECKPGTLQCIGGQLVCAGEKARTLEVCDCLDNDCDGKVDEDPGASSAICPSGSACVMCQCAQECRDAGEFAQTCPAGKVALSVAGGCRCVGERCNATQCAARTITVGDEVVCAPDQKAVGPCVCKENECSGLCTGVVCSGDLVCDAKDGLCKEKSCLLTQFACEAGQYCDVTTKGCVPDACADTQCAADQGCRDGQCFPSCGHVMCEADQVCKNGECVKDKCRGVNCAGLQVCDPASGECTNAGTCLSFACAPGFVCDAVTGDCNPDPCVRTTCPKSEICKDGECQLRCEPPLLDCDGTCINPASSRKFCGAKADCMGDNAGKTCKNRQVCSEGECSDTCQSGTIVCEGGCIDPLSDELHCGASGDCQGSRGGVACGEGYRCQAGECLQEAQADAGTNIPEKPKRRVSVTGGGGCACNLAPRPAQPDLRWLVCLSGFALVGLRRRVRRVIARSSQLRTGWLRALIVVCLALFGAGCKVNTFCLDCDDGSSGGGGHGGRNGLGGTDNPDGSIGGKGGSGGSGGEGEGGDGPDASFNPDASTGDAGPIECLAIEICNGRDDDCDGNVDEGTDPASENIDVKTDVDNCGACGKRCVLSNAFSKCESGTCAIDSCDPEYLDFDDMDSNGCEYRCRKSANDDTLCNQRDDDCDHEVDEDVDFQHDLNNCGSCNNACKPANAADGGVCDNGTCKLDATKCNAGFIDADGVYANGCEYQCTKTSDGLEKCNGADDDCDKRIDEGVAVTDSRLGVACGDDTGECSAGVAACSSAGAVVCMGSKGPVTETCNGVDDDCDGNTDESFPQLGLPCGADLGECVRGNQQCMSGMLVCVGAVGSTNELCNGKDDDCDGKTDESPENVGKSCVTAAGGGITLDPPAAVGECKLGVATCMSGVLSCTGEVGPKPELCDDKDQDCDGDNVNGVSTTDPLVGASCGIDLGECSFGTYICNSSQQRECLNGKLPVAEICNGKDDDCDGNYDETDSVTHVAPVGAGEPCKITGQGAVDHSQGVSVQGECKLGTTVCSGGSIGCPDYVGPKPELCDDKDQDCDGVLNNGVASTDPQLGQTCAGNSMGTCQPGTTYCNNGAVACQNTVGPALELCDGLDNDCDGTTTDDGVDEPTRGQACGTDTGACVAGTIQCVGGSMVCAGSTAAVAETCDSADNDCDGKVDEDFQLQTNVNRCGTCNNACSFQHATAQCVNGQCQIASCDTNYHDNPSTPTADCSVGPCVISGTEICNGLDDNCNGSVDEGLTAPTGVCNVVGACAGAVATCQGVSGWVCSKLPTTEKCNGVDDNCNGQNNEGFVTGAVCYAAGTGGCATAGTLQCNAGGTATFCGDENGNPVVAGTPNTVQETCNGVDDDCDGHTDEACPGTTGSCVTDAWVSLGGGVDIYKYEASRPDAKVDSSGSSSARACSTVNKLPWTNVTYAQALAACKAADPNGRLCTEGEWEQACMDDPPLRVANPDGLCTWGYPDDTCDTYSSNRCNGLDYSSTPDIQPTGTSGASNSCYRGPADTTALQIFELSGNVKEYVMQRNTGGIPVRGGATNNTQDGLRCDFDFSVWPNNSPFTNVGFRCCRSATALPVQCGTFSVSGLDLWSSTLSTSTMDVSLIGTITDVNVASFRGTHSRMSQVDYMELVGPDNTTVRLINSNASCDDSDDDWNFVFDSAAGSNVPAATGATVSPCGGGNTYKPAQTLDAFNSKSAVGTWTIRVHDSSSSNATDAGSGRSPHINSWSLQICVNPN